MAGPLTINRAEPPPPKTGRLRAAAAGSRIVLLAGGIAVALLTAAALPAAAASPDGANARIARLIPQRLHDPVLGHLVAVRVFDMATDKVVYSQRAATPFQVASNTKIVTAATALQTMGPAHHFPTKVVLGYGRHVYIVGGGDPLLSSSTLRSLAARTAKAVKARGLHRVYVHLDDTLFAPWTGLPSGFDHQCGSTHSYRGYCLTPVHALTYDRRYGADNGRDAAAYFTRALNAAAGLAATYRGRAAAPSTSKGAPGISGAAGPEVVAAYAGHRLDVVIRAMFFPSDDEIAETLFRHVAVATGRPGSMNGARAAQRQVLHNLGVPLAGVGTSSGSGRSSRDRFTARAMVQLLRTAIDGHHPRMAVLRDGTAATGGHPLLMRAGIDGTLASSYGRYASAPSACARGKVYAKTGSIALAITLSGYAKGADGRWKVFSILVNNRPMSYTGLTTRQHVDRIAATVTGCY